MPNNDRLLYNSDNKEWLLDTDGGYWTIPLVSDVSELSSLQKIHFTNMIDLGTDRQVLGTALIKTIEPNGCVVTLQSNDPTIISKTVKITSEYVDYHILEPRFGVHQDRWIDVNSEFVMSNFKTLGLRMFVPEDNNLSEKKVDFLLCNDPVKTAMLPRGETTEIWIDIPDKFYGRADLRIQCEYPENNNDDDRRLGAILVEFNPDMLDWFPAGDLIRMI